MLKQAKIILSGMVQGVGLRYKCRYMASKHALTGTIENLSDGNVSIVCEGEDETIEKFVGQIRDFKEPITVSKVKIEYSEPSGQFKCFSIISGDVLKELVEGFSTGAMYLDDINNKQDKMLDKQDKMLDKQDKMLDKQDETLVQIKIISSDVKTLSESIINTMNSRFEKLENDMAILKAKLAV